MNFVRIIRLITVILFTYEILTPIEKNLNFSKTFNCPTFNELIMIVRLTSYILQSCYSM